MSFRGFIALQWVMERLPRGLAYALAIVVARVAYRFARKARRRLEFNLQRALPEKSPQEIHALAWRNFRNHSKAYADLMQLPRARVEELRPLLHVEGMTNLDAALARRKGVLAISAHMGSWEIAAAIWSATIAPVSLFAEELEPPELFDWYRNTRQRLGISVLPLTRAGLSQVVQALAANEMIVTAVDRDLQGTGLELEFFGHPATIPTGPATLAVRRGAAVLPVAVLRNPDDTYEAIGYPMLVADPAADPKVETRRLTELLVRHMERIIREHPDQWHMPHRIWPDAP
jgi:phosphatidylinositol dimannoside acyltransferase